jgi:hypothetical protein
MVKQSVSPVMGVWEGNRERESSESVWGLHPPVAGWGVRGRRDLPRNVRWTVIGKDKLFIVQLPRELAVDIWEPFSDSGGVSNGFATGLSGKNSSCFLLANSFSTVFAINGGSFIFLSRACRRFSFDGVTGSTLAVRVWFLEVGGADEPILCPRPVLDGIRIREELLLGKMNAAARETESERFSESK